MEPRVDKHTHGQKTVLTVKHSMRGRWEVCDAALEEPLADFEQRQEAVDYARGIAATKSEASVQTFDEWGDPEPRESYALDTGAPRDVLRTRAPHNVR